MPGNDKKTGRFRAVLASIGLALLLVSCGTGADSEAPLDTPPANETVNEIPGGVEPPAEETPAPTPPVDEEQPADDAPPVDDEPATEDPDEETPPVTETPAEEPPPVVEVIKDEPLAPSVVAMVRLGADQTLEEAARATGGRAIRDNRSSRGNGRGSSLSAASALGDGSIGFLAFDSMPLSSQMAADSEFDIVFEENLDRFVTSASLVEVYGTGLELQGRSTVWAEGSSKVWAEGRSTVWAEGRSTVWAEGRSTVWAEGRSTVWAEGRFTWMPENTPVWNRIGLRDAHSEARNLGRGVVVAVIDTGIDATHPALIDAISPEGWNFVENNDDPSEVGQTGDHSYGHGTVVADIVRQIAPRATILPIRALESDGSGDVFNVVRAVYYAVDNGADIINMSLGGPEESPSLTEAIEYANNQGVFVTISTGNDDKASLNYPSAIAGNLTYVISVTSVDNRDVKSRFSNYGAGAEIAALGENIVGPYPDFGLAQWSGTSMAAPQVAGALALALGERELDVRKSELPKVMFEEGVGLYSGSGPRNQNRQYRNDGPQYVEYPLGRTRLDIEEFIDEAVDD